MQEKEAGVDRTESKEGNPPTQSYISNRYLLDIDISI